MKRHGMDPVSGNFRDETLAEWAAPLAQGAVAGSLASLLSSAVLMFSGWRETGSAATAANATSQWIWGDEALEQQQFDLPHTATGYLIHHGAALFWALGYAALTRKLPVTRTPAGIAAGAVATSAMAYLVDFKMTPSRLTPGFEKRLSQNALYAGYGALALGLAAGAWLMRDRYPEAARQPVRTTANANTTEGTGALS
jgi:hypothetical protein